MGGVYSELVNRFRSHRLVAQRQLLRWGCSFAFAVGMGLVVLHAIVLASKPRPTGGPRTNVLSLPSVDAVVTSQVAQSGKQTLANFAQVSSLQRRHWERRLLLNGAGVDKL